MLPNIIIFSSIIIIIITLAVVIINILHSADKIFITDVVDGKIFVGENSGFDFHGEDIREIPLRGVDAPTGIDYDYRTDKIYWSDENARTINRASLDGSEQEILIGQSQGIGGECGLDIKYLYLFVYLFIQLFMYISIYLFISSIR